MPTRPPESPSPPPPRRADDGERSYECPCADVPSRTYKAIANATAKDGYRGDLRGDAVARASAIRQSQRAKKDLPESKLRGAKARKAAEEKEE